MTTSDPARFRRHIIYNYPARQFADDIASHFEHDAVVTVMIESVAGIQEGSEVVEVIFQYRDGNLIRVSERTFIYQ